MPVRSLRSSIKKWPGRTEVFDSFRAWAHRQMESRSDIVKIGCFGSLAAGAWGVGSDIDIIIILDNSTIHPFRRAVQWDTTPLPVPADIVVLTIREVEGTISRRFRNVLDNETVWVEMREEK